jgi:hypothetical protein
MIERNFADKLAVSPEAASNVKLINDELGVQWLISFLSADKKKTYCLYEAESQEAIRESARRVGIPVDNIIEVGELHNTGAESPIQQARFG